MPHKRVYVWRVVRGRSVVVGYEDVHLVGYRGVFANTFLVSVEGRSEEAGRPAGYWDNLNK